MTNFKNGTVKISNDIIDQLIAEAALRVEGVSEVRGYKNGTVDSKKKDGIVSVVEGENMMVAITIRVKENHNVLETCEKAQKEIRKTIHNMLGLNATKVNVIVKELVTE